ncbi:MAG: FAD-dependent monooxygenase [Proteobacteria bacterium]|nr:FAD-dependent monooxygenase [Pseudomonadota bacterium]
MAASNCPHWREAETLRFKPTLHDNGNAPVVIIGAGPIGLTLAIDLAQRDIPVVVIDKRTCLSRGSRAICWSRRSLDVFNRIGIGDTMRAVGAQWQVGRVYHKENEIYSQRLTPEVFPENPFFVNFQQSLCECLLVQTAAKYPTIDLRWQNELIDIHQQQDGALLRVCCADGEYDLQARYVVACDGAKSLVRKKFGLSFEGKKFQDRFLIADIEMHGDFPTERRFWFEPPFHAGQSTLLHKQAQNIWRVDFQLDTQDDISAEQIEADKDEKNVRQRISAFLGRDDLAFDVVWCSVYFFTCQRIPKFRYGNVFFAGDSAHVVSPFGARGGNGGIEDANNLGWKLAEVLHNRAGEDLLDSYNDERVPACDDNILNSSRTTDFMTPKSTASKRIRDTVLTLARRYDFAKKLVNAGRMSTAFSYRDIGMFNHSLSGNRRVGVGDVGVDVPLVHQSDARQDYLLRHIHDYTLLAYKRDVVTLHNAPPYNVISVGDNGDWQDTQELMTQYYFNEGGGYALFRPDQYLLGICDDNTPKSLITLLRKYRKEVA